jgi:hypothetical protein
MSAFFVTLNWVLFLHDLQIPFSPNFSHHSFWGNQIDMESRQNKELVKELSEPAPDTKDLSFPTEFSQPLFQQLICTLWKQHLTYWRSPDYNIVRFFFTLSTALVFGSLFWQIGTTRWVKKCTITIFLAPRINSTIHISGIK